MRAQPAERGVWLAVLAAAALLLGSLAFVVDHPSIVNPWSSRADLARDFPELFAEPAAAAAASCKRVSSAGGQAPGALGCWGRVWGGARGVWL